MGWHPVFCAPPQGRGAPQRLEGLWRCVQGADIHQVRPHLRGGGSDPTRPLAQGNGCAAGSLPTEEEADLQPQQPCEALPCRCANERPCDMACGRQGSRLGEPGRHHVCHQSWQETPICTRLEELWRSLWPRQRDKAWALVPCER